MDDPRMIRFRECSDRIKEGPIAYCNPEQAYADAVWLFEQLNASNQALVKLHDSMGRQDG